MKKILAFCMLFFLIQTVSGQQEMDEAESEKHHISVLAAYVYIPKGELKDKRGIYAPVIGLEYEYLINNNWAMGIIGNYEIKEYSVNINGEDVKHHNILVLAIAGFYDLTEHLQLFAGPGIEIESHKNFFLLKTGIKYSFEFGNSWNLTPFIESDIKEKHTTFAVGLSFGKKF